MSSATLCFTGFSRDDLAQAQAFFEQANGSAGHAWSQAPEADASVLVIDMDSMYGHMTWLRASGSGRRTVGVTAGERCETDFLLRRPLSVESIAALLGQLETGKPAPAADTTPPAPKSAEPTPASAPAPAADPLPDPVRAEAPMAESSEDLAKAAISGQYLAAVTTGQMAAMPANAVPHRPALSDLLAPGVLAGPSRLRLAGAPDLLLDPRTQTWAGSATLKPLLPYVQAELTAADAAPIDPAEFEALRASAQPYMRLLWLCALTLGEGKLLTGFTPARKFVLTKWPQIEREFPKHFRIATMMMKGPALVQDIADATGATPAEVADFVNAGLVSGAVVVEGSPAEGGDPARAAGLLARPRAG
jgi:hypothetical protein